MSETVNALVSSTRLSKLRPSLLSDGVDRIDWTYMPGDHMLGPTANHTHYREVGESALRAIYASLLLANVESPNAILDFGCGSGRVTRWFKAIFPTATIDASDVRRDSLEFLDKQFGVNTWPSNPNVDELKAPRSYDLIWSGSVLTHLPEETSSKLLNRFVSWLKPNGVCVVTTHGRRMLQNMNERRLRYMAEEQEEYFLLQLKDRGYAYVPYKGQNIGVSACTVSWLTGILNELGVRVVTVSEHAWDKHQDVVAFQAPGPR